MWADAIANYTHWAWSDVVVYGDLGRVLMPHVRSARAHSVITMTPNHEHWCDMSHALFSGQLTVFRNDAATNALKRFWPESKINVFGFALSRFPEEIV